MPADPDPKPTVQEAWLAVMRDVGAIDKSESANAGKFSYSFRGVERTVNAVQPVLIRHGVIVVPVGMRYETTEFVNGNNKREEEAQVTVDWLVTGPAGDSFTMQSIGSASDTSDKAVIQATSVAHRVGLLIGLQIPTVSGEDEPDHSHTERAAADDAAAVEGGWQDAAQRNAVWDAILATAQALPKDAHDAVVLPWAKEVKLDPSTFTVAQSDEWKAKIIEAAGTAPGAEASEPPPPSSPAASPQEPEAASSTAKSSAPSDFGGFPSAEVQQEAFADLTEKNRRLGTKDAEAMEAFLQDNGVSMPEKLTKALAAEWFARLSDVLGAAVAENPEPRQWKSAAERKRTWKSLFERMNRLPEMNSISDWFDQSGFTEESLTADESEEWLAKIAEAEFAAEAPY